MDYCPSMNGNKLPNLVSFPITSQAKTFGKMCNPDSQPYIPKRQYSELISNEEIFLDKSLTTLEKINTKLHKRLARHKHFPLLSWVLGWGIYVNAQNIKKI